VDCFVASLLAMTTEAEMIWTSKKTFDDEKS
jgi:hypothetical protein